MRRELGIALGAPLTWVVAAGSALLVGHGFVLAVDLYSASSRSALASVLQAKEMDPLAGIVRPTLGGLDLAISLFVPLMAARTLSVDKERRSFGSVCLLEGTSNGVVAKKVVAALCAGALLLAAPTLLFAVFVASGGHLDAIETTIALTGEALHLLLMTTVAIAAAAWTRTTAQAAAAGIALALTSWAIDAAEGFAALAWLGGASAWSIERQLQPFARGLIAIGPLAWLLAASAGAVALAFLGARFDGSTRRRNAAAIGALLVVAVLLAAAGRSRRAFDWTEQRRASLPPAAVEALRHLSQALALEVLLDRDDSRRRQLESDVIAKLYLARPDLTVRTPLDEREPVLAATHDGEYGRITVHVGPVSKETRSTSRRELVTLIFEAAGMKLPDWSMLPYPGFPFVVEGARRTLMVLVAYVVVPVLFLTGALFTRRRFVR